MSGSSVVTSQFPAAKRHELVVILIVLADGNSDDNGLTYGQSNLAIRDTPPMGENGYQH